MTQLDLFATPSAPQATKAKVEKPQRKSSWEFERDRLDSIRKLYRSTLPTDDEGIVATGWRVLQEYHASVCRADVDAQAQAANQLDAIREHAFGFGQDAEDCWKGNGRFDCLHAAGTWLSDCMAKPDGQVPLFGQKGRLLLNIAGCRVDFKYDGMFGICGGAAHVVDLDQPFFSETGYRSFQVSPHDHLIFAGGLDPAAWLARVCEAQLSEGGKKSIKLKAPPFGSAAYGEKPTDDHIRARREIDPAWLPGGYLHDLGASQ